MIKKIALIIIIAFIVSFFAGCGDSPPPNRVHSPEDVGGKDIGAFRGTPSERLASELGVARAFETGEELMYQLRAGTIDCVIIEHSVAAELISGMSGVRILSEPLLVYDLRFAVAKENTELLKAVDSALAALRANGTLKGLRDRYFSGRRYTYVPPEDVVGRPGTLTLAVPPDSPPFSVMDSYGEFSGLDIDVARAVSDALGVELLIIEYDAWELVSAVRYGRADLALGWLPSEGEELVNVSEPYAYAEHIVVVRR